MKNLFFIFAITLALTSCSNQPNETTVDTTDSTAVVVDTVVTVAVDTAVADSVVK